jgi:hypothetical protein
MLGGAYYIWIMLTFFLGCGALLLLVGGVLWVGHWMERSQTGAKHGFLEMPEELRGTRDGGGETEAPNHQGTKNQPD